MKTLLVEDALAHAKIIKRALGSFMDAQDVFHVSDGGLALDYVYARGAFADRASNPRPELILLDLRMPRVDGFAVLRVLKSDENTRAIPIVVLSTSDRLQDINRCYTSGANAFFTKPMDFSEFSTKVAELCHFWQSTAETPSAA